MTKISAYSDEGQALFRLLQKAAGLEGFPIQRLEVHLATKEPIIFKAEMIATAENVSAALQKTPEEMAEAVDKVAG